MVERIPVVIDCDPGIDDAIALLLALASPELEVRGITTVSGNVRVEDCTRNALCTLDLVGNTTIPVAQGACRPLVHTFEGNEMEPSQVHGELGLGAHPLPEPRSRPVQQHAVDLLADVANDYPGAVTLVAIAPLTNLALLAACYPGTLQKYKRLVVMGGSSKEGGNQNAAAEFNFWADPAAAQRVLDEDLDITLVGLDVTHQATLDQADVSHLRSADGRIGPLVAEMLDFYVGWHRKTYGSSALPMHDALAVASVIWPELLETADVNIRVDLSTTMTRGLSLVDLWGFDGGPTNAKWATAVRSADFRSVLLERLRGLSTAANTSIEGGPRS